MSPGSNANTHDAYGMTQNVSAARARGKIAGDARAALEAKTGRKVVSASNYKDPPEAEVRKQLQSEGEEQKNAASGRLTVESLG